MPVSVFHGTQLRRFVQGSVIEHQAIRQPSADFVEQTKKNPWKIVGLLLFETKKEALIAEKKLKNMIIPG